MREPIGTPFPLPKLPKDAATRCEIVNLRRANLAAGEELRRLQAEIRAWRSFFHGWACRVAVVGVLSFSAGVLGWQVAQWWIG